MDSKEKSYAEEVGGIKFSVLQAQAESNQEQFEDTRIYIIGQYIRLAPLGRQDLLYSYQDEINEHLRKSADKLLVVFEERLQNMLNDSEYGVQFKEAQANLEMYKQSLLNEGKSQMEVALLLSEFLLQQCHKMTDQAFEELRIKVTEFGRDMNRALETMVKAAEQLDALKNKDVKVHNNGAVFEA